MLTVVDVDQFTGGGHFGQVGLRDISLILQLQKKRKSGTHIVYPHILVVTSFGVLVVSRNDELVASGNFDLRFALS